MTDLYKSTRQQVFDLERELWFWEELHKHELPSELEFKLADRIRQLKNPDQFGISRYDGHIEDEDEDEDEDQYCCQASIMCKYCKKDGFQWVRYEGKWRLANGFGVHICDAWMLREREKK